MTLRVLTWLSLTFCSLPIVAGTPLQEPPEGRHLVFVIPTLFRVEAAKVSPPQEITSVTSVASELNFQDGQIVSAGALDHGDDVVVCSLRVWKGLIFGTGSDSSAGDKTLNKSGFQDFDLQGAWVVSDVRSTSMVTTNDSGGEPKDSVIRVQTEMTLWPTRPHSTWVEKSIFDLKVIRRFKGSVQTGSIVTTTDAVDRCFGPHASLKEISAAELEALAKAQ